MRPFSSTPTTGRCPAVSAAWMSRDPPTPITAIGPVGRTAWTRVVTSQERKVTLAGSSTA